MALMSRIDADVDEVVAVVEILYEQSTHKVSLV